MINPSRDFDILQGGIRRNDVIKYRCRESRSVDALGAREKELGMNRTDKDVNVILYCK